jgi:hypothetical protein
MAISMPRTVSVGNRHGVMLPDRIEGGNKRLSGRALEQFKNCIRNGLWRFPLG